MAMLFSCNKDNSKTDNIASYQGYKLIWNDEFNDASVNSANWTYETGAGTAYGLPAGWGNNEKQVYTNNSQNSGILTDGNASVMAITALESDSGAYLEMAAAKDLSNYTSLKFALNIPSSLVNAEIKLESQKTSTSAIVYLKNYTGIPVSSGFVEYSIPLADFKTVKFCDLTIPFAMWNAQDANSKFVRARVPIDDIRFE